MEESKVFGPLNPGGEILSGMYRAGRPICRMVLLCFSCELPGPAWAVGSYSSSQSAGGTSQNIIFKTLRQIRCPALYAV